MVPFSPFLLSDATILLTEEWLNYVSDSACLAPLKALVSIAEFFFVSFLSLLMEINETQFAMLNSRKPN